jgi:hypothetical protein
MFFTGVVFYSDWNYTLWAPPGTEDLELDFTIVS